MAAPDPTAPLAAAPAGATGRPRTLTIAGELAAGWAVLTGALLLCGTGIAGSPAVAEADRSITDWLVAHRSPGLDQAMRALTVTGSWIAGVALAVVVVVLVRTRRIGGPALVAVLVGWGGEVAAVQLTKAVVRRPRPPDSVRLVPTHGWAFPSGHTATAVVVFGSAATLTWLLVRRRWVRATVPPLAGAVVCLIAFSRVELGAHWATDVAAALVWTPAWLTLAAAVTAADRRDRAGRLAARRWEARLSLASVVVAVGLMLGSGGRRGIALGLLTAAAVVVAVIAAFWFLRTRGVPRMLMGALAAGAPVAVLAVLAAERQLWVAVVAGGLLVVAGRVAHLALRPPPSEWDTPVADAPPPRRPFLVMNPRSGGGKVARFGLVERAEALGAEVALLDGAVTDVQELARNAVARGADLLGAAGGDGTQALVAQVAAEHDVPFLVISAGTRNHFALDLGLNRADPGRCLEALRDGVEARLDLGDVDGRPFVNNASFGAYAEIVDDPAYRDDKRRTTLDALPDLLSGRRGAPLRAEVDGVVVEAPQALLVSNNPYEDGDLAGLGRRARLDRGVLGVVALRVDSPRQAVGLLHHATARGLQRGEAREVVVHADAPSIPVGIDGEAVRLPPPVRCRVRPGVLRVRLPRDRPGIRPPAGRWDWPALWRLAVGRPVALPGLGPATGDDQRHGGPRDDERTGQHALDVVGLRQHGDGQHGEQRAGAERRDQGPGEAGGGIQQRPGGEATEAFPRPAVE